MPDQDYLLLLTGRTVAFDMLLRALYAKWAAETGDPQAFITHTIESIIGSIDAAKQRPTSEAERSVWEAAETELRSFMENVSLRLQETRKP
jgi:hypothetical protein